MGVCSVQYGEQVVALSPRRFLQDNAVFYDIADHCFGGLNDLLLFEEVSIPGARHLGRFDYVMVKHRPLSSEVEDLAVIEFQTGQTTSTGHLVAALEDFMGGADVRGASYGFGLNLADIWKRAFTQVLTKGIVLERWGHRVYWVVQEPIYQDFLGRYKLHGMSYEPSHSTVFTIYDLRRAGEVFHTTPGRRRSMDIHEKIELLGRASQYDLCGDGCGTQANRVRDELGRWIYPAVMPDGKRVKLLKVLQSNACTNDCYYCVNRVGRDIRRLSFSPDELAHTFDQMQCQGLVQGLFLSSAICGRPTQAMDRMLATVELVRRKYQFLGYVHFKILPGVTQAHVEQAARLASRLSINLESPNSERLARIAPGKSLKELVEPMRAVHRIRLESGGRLVPAGQTTQFVVGAADEPDREVLHTVAQLYQEVDLHRAYFSAFQPVPDTPLAEHPPTPLWREHRLYQSDFLLRQYAFTFDELIFNEDSNLPRQADPKRMWAMAHPEIFPIEVNRASREQLLRVPGIGPRSAGRILRQRHKGKFRTLTDLKRAGTVIKWAAPFVLLDGRPAPYQMELWPGEAL